VHPSGSYRSPARPGRPGSGDAGAVPFAGELVPAGDGVLAIAGSSVAVLDSVLTACARAAVLVSDGGGRVTGCRAGASRFGLVVDTAPESVTIERNVFEGIAEEDEIVRNRGLPIPSEPLASPPRPELEVAPEE